MAGGTVARTAAPMTEAARRLLAVLPAHDPRNARRLAHDAGLHPNPAERGLRELRRGGYVRQVGWNVFELTADGREEQSKP